MNDGQDLHTSYIANCVFNAFLSYTATVLNSVTIHTLRKTLSLPQPLKTLLLSLAVSDLGVGLIAQPLNIAANVKKMEQNTENCISYKTTYTAYITSLNLFTFASCFGVTALSADRFLAINLHLRYQELVTHKRVVIVVITMWASSAFLSIIRWWIPIKIIYAIFIIFCGSCTLTITILNYKIYKAVRPPRKPYSIPASTTRSTE